MLLQIYSQYCKSRVEFCINIYIYIFVCIYCTIKKHAKSARGRHTQKFPLKIWHIQPSDYVENNSEFRVNHRAHKQYLLIWIRLLKKKKDKLNYYYYYFYFFVIEFQSVKMS